MKKPARAVCLILLCSALFGVRGYAEPQKQPQAKKTQVIIIGTLHKFHYNNSKYPPEVLKEIILALKPDAILNELPLSLVDPNGRPIESIRSKSGSCPDAWAADEAAMELGVRQIPYDRPDRQDNFKKTNFFERREIASKSLTKWVEWLKKENPECFDLKITQLWDYAYETKDYLFENFGPEIINSDAYDSAVRMVYLFWFDVLPDVIKNYPSYKSLVDHYHFERDQWNTRNKIMADNIIKAVKEYPGKRLVVITGATHRYILRDLLKDEPNIDLKEYWEIIKPDTEKSEELAYAKLIPADKLKEDLDFLFKTIEQVHPNMYAYTPKEEFTPVCQQLYEDINQPMKQVEFFKVVSPVIAQLKNGHMNLGFPDEFEAYTASGGKVFPLKFYWDGKKAILSENRGHDVLPMGGIVKAINNQEVDMLLQRLGKYRADECKNNDEFFAGTYLHRYLWLEYGLANSWELQIKNIHGKTNDYVVKGIPWKEYLANNPHKPDFAYEYLVKYNTALISFKSCSNLEKFTKFLKETFQEIKEQKVSNLIIDIRHNVGGQSTVAQALLDYITEKPFRMGDRINIKVSHQMYGADLDIIRDEFQDETIEIGSIIMGDGDFIQPSNNSLRFKGKCYLLIDRLVFSSACQLASVIKCFDLATIIGEETWGTTAAYGAIRKHIMPNSGLGFDVPSKYIVQPCGKPDGRGVIPDYEVKQKPEDTAKGVDTVLQFTLDLIKKPDTGLASQERSANQTNSVQSERVEK